MLKKYLLIALVLSLSLQATEPAVQSTSFGMINPKDGSTVFVSGISGQFGSWLLCGKDDAAKKVVTGLFIWCVVYTLYRSAKGMWSLWHDKDLSPEVKREIERVLLLIKHREQSGDVTKRVGSEMLPTQKSEQHNEQKIVQSVACSDDTTVQPSTNRNVSAHVEEACVCGKCHKYQGTRV